ncbi:hypothetical protein BGZ65_002651, partial [Modicella reniformis]
MDDLRSPQAIAAEDEPGNKTGDKNKKNDLSSTKYNFVARLFDIILVEISTSSRTVKVGSSPENPIYVVAEFGELATCFKIAEEVCQAEADLHPHSSESSTSHWSVDLSEELSQAGLSRKKTMEDYVNTMHEHHRGIFTVCTGAGTNDDDRPENSSSSKKWDVIRSGQRLMVPVFEPKDIDGRIRYRYHGKIPDNYKTMIASIVYKLRMTLWKDIISTLQPDVVMKEVGVQYGPKPSSPKDGVQPLMYSNTDRIAQKLEGLKIKTSGKKTFGLQGEHELVLADP